MLPDCSGVLKPLLVIGVSVGIVSCGGGGGGGESKGQGGPSALAFGANAPAGSGYIAPAPAEEVHVTNLDDSGPGSLRDCSEEGKRTCVFDISGEIHLASPLVLKQSRITIAGQTAPDPGIALVGAGIHVRTHDVLIQHLEVRVGDSKDGPNAVDRDGVLVGDESGAAYNVVLDHLSISWAVDENFDVSNSGTHDVTVSHCIISEGLQKSIHPKGKHSKGALINDGVNRISIHHSLFAHNFDRNPRLMPGSSVEFISNVVYNWGGDGTWNLVNLSGSGKGSAPILLNFEGNYYKPGPDSIKKPLLFAESPSRETRIYAARNVGPTRAQDTGDEWLISSLERQPHYSSTVLEPRSSVQTLPASETLQYVLENAGARPWARNATDERVINDVKRGTGRIKDCVSGCSKSAG